MAEQQINSTQKRVAPLRLITARPDDMHETLECGHTINRPLGLGEYTGNPSKAKRRRCYICAEAL